MYSEDMQRGTIATDDRWARYGAASGAISVALYLVGAAVAGTPPDFDASGAEVAAYFAEERTQLQIGSAFFAASAPFLIWFLATVASLARAGGPRSARAGAVAFGCGASALTLFLADVAALAVGALRPENMAAAPELAAALLDFSFLAIAMATFLASAVFAAFAMLALRDRMLWPAWVGWLAVVAACAYSLRIGALFTTEGAFAADGVLGLIVPVSAYGGWMVIGSVVLTARVRSQ